MAIGLVATVRAEVTWMRRVAVVVFASTGVAVAGWVAPGTAMAAPADDLCPGKVSRSGGGPPFGRWLEHASCLALATSCLLSLWAAGGWGPRRWLRVVLAVKSTWHNTHGAKMGPTQWTR